MKPIRVTIITFAVLLMIPIVGPGQTPENTNHFAKDGLTFDYPKGWTLQDQSTANAQQLTLALADSDAQIRIFVHRGKADTPEKMAMAKRGFIDPYVKSTNDTFVQAGAKPEQTPDSAQIGGASAEGVRIRATLSGETGEASIYWASLGNRVVLLTFFGSDQSRRKAAPAWDAVRNSIHIEDIKPPPKPTPKP